MRISTLLLSFAFILFAGHSTVIAQDFEPCVAEIEFQKAAEENPDLLKIRDQLEVETQEWITNNERTEARGGNYVIPCVFHILHTCGSENISRAQIMDQMRILNEDFARTNADAVNTPLPFANISVDSEIEFRLAQLDPNGNCTDGINRIYTQLTHSADPRNSLKSANYWPRDKYLNIWVVSTILNTSGSGGTILGYAQFPGGAAATDGIVVRADRIGSIGTASTTSRTATHEVGHWLNLRHIWGDNTCGNDMVNDTPTQETSNSGCPTFPHITCNNGPNGDMFMNYMDYSSHNCKNAYSAGQRDRMHASLNSSISNRNNLHTAANLAATGVDQIQLLCTPVADFCKDPIRICEGAIVTFNDHSTNGDVATWNWSFPGGTPATATVENPNITYNTWGQYDVSLTVSNSSGQSSISRPRVVIVSRAAAWYTVPFTESFENILFPGGFWFVDNPGGNAWEATAQAAYTGIKSIKLNNYSGNTQEGDVFYTPTYNLSNVSQTMMTFKLAFAARSSSSADKLQIYVSTNCGRTWSLRYTKTGLALATAGIVSTDFIPTQLSQWREESINLSSSSISGRDNVMFRFVYTNESGNNMFIDDINLTGVVGQEEILDQLLDLSIFPNPSSDLSTISFNLVETKDMQIILTDMLGRTVQQIENSTLSIGDHNYVVGEGLNKGMYFVQLNMDGKSISKKVILQ